MATAYYSIVFEQPAAEVWKIIRDFNDYPVWVGGAGESRMGDGKSGDAVGAVRSMVRAGTGRLRGWFAKWLESLRATMGQPAGFPEEHVEIGV